MNVKELVQEVISFIQPQLNKLMGRSTDLIIPTKQALIWEKIKPSIAEEIEELQKDPTDDMALNSIPNSIRKFLKGKEILQKELINLIEQIKNASHSDTATTISNSKNVINNSSVKSDRDVHIGDTNSTSTNIYGNTDKQWNIKENNGNFNFDNSKTTIHIGDVINIEQVLESNATTNTNEQEIIQRIHQLVTKNKIKQALEQLLQLTKNGDSDEHNQVILLTNRWNRLKQSRHAGILSTENGNIDQNRIMAALLNLLDDL